MPSFTKITLLFIVLMLMTTAVAFAAWMGFNLDPDHESWSMCIFGAAVVICASLLRGRLLHKNGSGKRTKNRSASSPGNPAKPEFIK